MSVVRRSVVGPAAPPLVGTGRVWSRRQFLARVGSGLALAAGGGLLVSGSVPTPLDDTIGRFVSRPDLSPPRLDVISRADGTAPGYVLVASMRGPGQRGPMIVDDAGRLVWFRPLQGVTAANFSVQRYRGNPVLVWWEGTVTNGYGRGEYVLTDPTYTEVGRVRAGNGLEGDLHEFVITAQDTALFTAYQTVRGDLSSVGGARHATLLDCVVQEVDIASGRVLNEWRASDHVAVGESYLPPSDGAYDFFHANSIEVGDDGNLLVSARHTWTVYNIDREGGGIIWRLGGKRSDFTMGPGTDFYWQHHARWGRDGSLTIFDDGAGPLTEETMSRGIRLDLDETARSATLAEQYIHKGYLADAMGSMQSLPDGGAFIGWGTVPGYSEFSGDGRLRLDAVFAGGGDSYRAFRQPWVGRPSDRPVVAIARVNGARYGFVSWNGSTSLRAWRLNAGTTSDALTPRLSVRSAGFETRIPLLPGLGYIAVDALDGAGRVLKSTDVIAV